MPGDARDIAARRSIAQQCRGVARIVPVVIVRDDLGTQASASQSGAEVILDEVVLVARCPGHAGIIGWGKEGLILRRDGVNGNTLRLISLDKFDKILRQWSVVGKIERAGNIVKDA